MVLLKAIMSNTQVPDDLAAFDDNEEEITDPNVDVDVFRGSQAASKSTVPGVLIMIKQSMAQALEGTFQNKEWVGEAKVYEQIQPPRGYTVLLVPRATYAVTRQEGKAVYVGFDMHLPAGLGSNSFAIPVDQIRAVHAYKQKISWYHRD